MYVASPWTIVQRVVFLAVVAVVAVYTKPETVDALVAAMIAKPLLGLGGVVFVAFVTLTAGESAS